MESSFKKTYKKIKRKAILDMLLRVVALFINYYITTFEFGSLMFNLLIGLEISIMSVNIFLEIKMYKEINLIIENKRHIEQDILTNEEMKTVIKDYYHLDKSIFRNLDIDKRYEIDKVFKLISLVGTTMVLIYVLYFSIIISFMFIGKEYRIVPSIIIFIAFIIYQYLNYIKLNLFYKDNKLANKVYFRDGILFTVGLSILYVSEAIIYINMSGFNIICFIFSALFILPSILTNKTISKEFHKVNKNILENKR